MQLSLFHKSVALSIAILLQAALLFNINNQPQTGIVKSGHDGIQLTLTPPATYQPLVAEEVTVKQVDVIEVEEVAFAEKVVKTTPVKIPRNIPTYQASVKPVERKTKPVESIKSQEKVAKTKNAIQELRRIQAPSTLAGSKSDRGLSQQAQASYQALIATVLQKHKKYPRRAASRRQEGIVTVKFIVKKTGDIISYELTSSSGHSLLDRAVETMLKKASPLPPFPNNLTEESITLILPVEFYLK